MRLLVNFLSFLLEVKYKCVALAEAYLIQPPSYHGKMIPFLSHLVYPVSLYTALRDIQPYQDTDPISQELLTKLGEVNTLPYFWVCFGGRDSRLVWARLLKCEL